MAAVVGVEFPYNTFGGYSFFEDLEQLLIEIADDFFFDVPLVTIDLGLRYTLSFLGVFIK